MALPVEINPLQLKSSVAVSQYTVNRSLRFRASASAYLNRTPASAGNRRTWTWSGWIKRGSLSSAQWIFDGYSDPNNFTAFFFNANNTFGIQYVLAATSKVLKYTTQVFNDSSAWYHIVVAIDTTPATPTFKVYVNGSEITSFGTNTNTVSQNEQLFVNNNIAHNIARYGGNANYFDGYIAELNFVDGQALAPTDFGAFDSNGVWQPKAYTGTYGTNGFYLPFTNTSSLTTLVADSSGNSNNWTANNISLTAGATYDSMIDSPTVASGASNYCVLNPVNTFSATLTNANLQVALTGSAFGTFAVSSGKWYWEVTPTTSANVPRIGIYDCVSGFAQGRGDTVYSYVYLGSTGDKRTNSTASAYGSSYTANDVIGVALDLDAGTVTFYKNGVSQGVAFSGLTSIYAPEIACTGGSVTFNFNAGQSAFAYTPPTNHKALNAYNLTQSLINGSLYNASTLYTGTGATLSVSNSKFKPDLVWMKGRSGATDHAIYDSVRGTTLDIGSNLSTGQTTQTTGLTSFDTSGFTVGTLAKVNTSAATYVAWQWKAGNGTNVTNTSGSITSTVSTNVTSGCSIVTYTGTGSAATVGHGLGVAPALIIIKKTSAADNWAVYHVANPSPAASYALTLNATSAAGLNTTYFNATAPTSTVFSVGTAAQTNTSGATYVAYCFATVDGYSKFGQFIGNGSATDGPFVYTGFKPKFVIVKRSVGAVASWFMIDTSRDSYNLTQSALYSNLANAQATSSFGDVLSNGFKIKSTAGELNTNGSTYVYIAFAENPFKYARAS